MTRTELLEQLKLFTEEATKDLLMPTKPQKDGEKEDLRAAAVYKMRLDVEGAAKKKVPYIIHRIITSNDKQTPGEYPESTATVQSTFCVYNKNSQEGGLMLLGLMERFRIELLKKQVIGGQFQIDLSSGLEYLVVPEDTAPYFSGEMVTTWNLPVIKREVIF